MSNEVQKIDNKKLASKKLVTLDPQAYAAAVFEPFNLRVQSAIAHTTGVVYDIKTKDGLATAKEFRGLFKSIRTEGEAERKDRKAPLLECGKLLDTNYKTIVDEVTPYEDKFDGEVKAEEARLEEIKAAKIKAEAEAIAAVQNRIDAIKNKPVEMINAGIEQLESAIADLQPIMPTKEDFGDRVVEAEYALKGAIDSIQTMLNGKRAQAQLDAQQAEAAKAQQAQIAEQNRIDTIKSKIQSIKNFIIEGAECETADEINALVTKLDGVEVLEVVYQEFTEEAKAAHAKAIGVLTRQHDAALNAEKTAATTTLIEQSEKPAEFVEVLKNQFQQKMDSMPTNKHPLKSDEPSVEMLVCIVAEGLKVDEMTAHRYLINANWDQYRKAA